MATTVAYSTLLVLLAESNQDLWDLWYLNASYNDPGGDKHTWSVRDVLQGGNFRSALIDSWDQEAFEEVTVKAVNMYGDVFWYTDFDVTGTSYSIPEWFTKPKIKASSALMTFDIAKSLPDDVNYALRTSPGFGSGKAWFLVTRGNYFYHRNMPRIFVSKSIISGFTFPPMMEGRQGCFADSSFTASTTNVFVDNSPYRCVSACVGGTDDAAMMKSTSCLCGSFSPGPTSDESKCQDPCPGNSTYTCGSASVPDHGDVYHIPGSSLPGAVLEIVQSFSSTSNPYQVQLASTFSTPLFVTGVHVTALITEGTYHGSYVFNYSLATCSNPKWTVFNFLNATNVEEPAELPTSTDIPVDVLRIKCIVVTLNASVTFVNLTIFTQDTSQNAEVKALIIEGKKTVPVTTSTTSTTAAATTTTAEATTTTEATTTVATTTTAAPPPTTTTTTTTTTTVAPTTTAGTTSVASTTQTTTAGVISSMNAGITAHESTTTSSDVVNSTTPSHCVRLCECTDAQLVIYNKKELLEKVQAIQNSLRINVLDLSSTRRKRTSAEDKRPVAVGIGYVGVAFLVTMLSFCLLLDAGRIWNCMKIIKGKL